MLTPEILFSVNKINKPKELTDAQTIYLFLIRLFLLEPNTFQSNPDMGIGLVSRYRYANSIDLDDLKYEAKDQISKYLPGLETVDVDISTENNDKNLNIQIKINDLVFNLNYDSQLQTFTE